MNFIDHLDPRNSIFRAYMQSLNLPQEAYEAIVDNPVLARSTVDAATLEKIVEGYQRGFRVVFLILVSLSGLAFILASVLMVNYSLNQEDDAALKVAAKQFLQEKGGKKVEKSAHGAEEI